MTTYHCNQDENLGKLIVDTEPKSNKPTIYDLAKIAVEERQKRFPAETVIVYENGKFRVRLYRYQELLMLDAVNGDPRQCVRVQVGYLCVYSGWTFSLMQREYERWAIKVKKLAGLTENKGHESSNADAEARRKEREEALPIQTRRRRGRSLMYK